MLIALATTEFPTEVIATSMMVLLYVLRLIDKRIGDRSGHVTTVQLLRAEMKWGKLLDARCDKLRLEFETKLETLARKLGG